MNRRWLALAVLCVSIAAWCSAGRAGEFDFSGFVAAELRIFPNDPAFSDQQASSFSPSLVLQPEFRYEWNRGDDRLTFIPFVHLDADDDERTHFDPRELNWFHDGGVWDLLLGFGKVFWGVTESRHLVDIINQTDGVEDLDDEDKLGQPMVNVNIFQDFGTLGLLLLPVFRERTFPDDDARLRGPLPVATDKTVFVDRTDSPRIDFAARWSHTIGDWDIGLYEFYGTGREPRLVPGSGSKGQPVLVPHYDIIDQTGLDVQWTRGSWLWKFEGLVRGGQGDRFGALAAGFEYSFFSIFATTADLGVIAEYLYDDRGDDAPATPFDDDIFMGMRLALNDVQSTAVLAGAIMDRDSQSSFFSVEAERRIGESWKIEVESRVLFNVPQSDIVFGLRDDDFIQIRLLRFF